MIQAPHNLSLLAPAKLNLFLHITGKRSDGYHELQTCFQLLDYGDELEFELLDSPKLKLESSIQGVATENNLVIKAAALLQKTCDTSLGATIRLSKKIPMGAGLGGGSSNAATTLLALNELWQCQLSNEDLANLGLSLGADIPLFIRGYSSWAQGIGEKLLPIELPKRWYLVISPPCHVSTVEIFSHEQLTRNTPTITIPLFPFLGTKNDCEAVAVALYPEIGAALDWLSNYSPARMTGTGSSVFASFETKSAADKALKELPEELKGFVAEGINTSPTLQALGNNSTFSR